jgi:uncharacterized protein (DUF1501 family)
MCDTLPKGSALEHGHEHTKAHATWSRRDFLSTTLAAAGFGFLLGNTPVKAFATHPTLQMLAGIETDRVLVLIQLNGGNDGLNTVIPITNDLYYQRRPSLAIRAADAFVLNSETALHPQLRALEALWGEGQMSILRNVGYPNPNLSHFRSTDIMVTGSDADVIENTGWMGRMLAGQYPEYPSPDFKRPLAVQIGTNASLMFNGPQAGMAMNITNVALFERLASSGKAYDTENVPATLYGEELAYLRSLSNQSYAFAGVVHEASQKGANQATYPTGNALATNLAIVAKLIKGGLGARVYMVSLGGFDTHANQADNHATLMMRLSGSVKAFYDDLKVSGMGDKVAAMTFSEFGRRVNENGSAGTDHGSSAPMFLFGGGVNGGLVGNAPSLSALDADGNLRFDTDYRQVYATMMTDWFGIAPEAVAAVFGKPFDTLDLVREPITTDIPRGEQPMEIELAQNFPNPFNPVTEIRYRKSEIGETRLSIHDIMGREISVLVDGVMPAGEHRVSFDATDLASGVYLYALTAGGRTLTRKMTVLK